LDASRGCERLQGWYRKSQGLDKKIKNDGILDIGGKKRCGSIHYMRNFHFKMYKSNYKIISSTIFDFVIFCLSVTHYAGLKPDAFLHKISDVFIRLNEKYSEKKNVVKREANH
jgi:hypothetical protein